jgi:hypothetical protein
VAALIDAAERNARAPKGPSANREELELVQLREKNLLATVADIGYTRELKELLVQLDAEKVRLQAAIDTEEEAEAIGIETLTRLRALGENPLAFYDARTEEQQAAILRLLISDAKIRTNGKRGSAHKYLAPEWRPLVSLNSNDSGQWS